MKASWESENDFLIQTKRNISNLAKIGTRPELSPTGMVRVTRQKQLRGFVSPRLDLLWDQNSHCLKGGEIRFVCYYVLTVKFFVIHLLLINAL